MIPRDRPANYHAGCNQHLLRAVPVGARRILEVGCAEGHLGAALKCQDPGRVVFGIEREPAVAARAAGRLDRVFPLDVESDDPPLEPGSVDCILYGDVLEHLLDPGAVLRRHRRLLGPGGIVLCSIPNAQHHSVLTALLTGDFQYTAAGLLDAGHLRFFTCSTILKLLLDAGFAPELVEAIRVPCPEPLFAALLPALRHLGLHPGRTRHYLEAYQYIARGTPLPYADPTGGEEGEEPLTFVACVSDEATAQANLLSSPCLQGDSPHEILLVRGCASAAEGLNRGLALARHPLVVCTHQDVYLPRGWSRRFLDQYRRAEQLLGPVGVAGVYGVCYEHGAVVRAGRVVDRDRLLDEPGDLPRAVETLDELLLALPRDTPLRFDPGLGFHFYGADVCLAARGRGLQAVALDALCLHNSRSVGLPPEFAESAARFAAKWEARLPLATSCVVLDRGGRMRLA